MSRPPTVLVVGDYLHAMYEADFCEGLRRAGANVVQLPITKYMGPLDLVRRFQRKYVVGPGVVAANAAMVAAAARVQPDLLLAWRTPWLWPRAIEAARRLGARRVVLYNNDDPFGPDRDSRIWRCFRRAIPFADSCYAYREVNLAEYQQAGARHVGLLMSGYSRALLSNIAPHDPRLQRWASDVVFVGHFEDDGRAEVIDRLLRTQLRVRVFGAGWEPFCRSRPESGLCPIQPVLGDDYVCAIRAAKTALVFLSARNRDDYTRRCFEIPAIGTLMVAPRTAAIERLYADGQEALLFDSADELLDQVHLAVGDRQLRQRVAQAGHRRCLGSGYDTAARARDFLQAALRIPTQPAHRS